MRRGIIAALMIWIFWGGTATAEERVALVIGNGAYAEAPLRNPPNDARLIAETLRRLGFDVIETIDATQNQMKQAIVDFGAKLEAGGSDSVGVFYYSGHGVQLEETNYLIPIDARISREAEVEVYGVNADWVVTQLKYARNDLNIVILDACRDNPYIQKFNERRTGLARMRPPPGTVIAFSTNHDEVASDGYGNNSPYTTALADAMNQPGVPITDMFVEVRRDVMAATGEQQVPVEETSITTTFYFNPTGGGEVTVTVPIEMSPDTVFWRSIERSGNPAEFQAFLDQFPQSPYAGLAQVRLTALIAPPPPELPPGITNPPPNTVVNPPPTTVIDQPPPVYVPPVVEAPPDGGQRGGGTGIGCTARERALRLNRC